MLLTIFKFILWKYSSFSGLPENVRLIVILGTSTLSFVLFRKNSANFFKEALQNSYGQLSTLFRANVLFYVHFGSSHLISEFSELLRLSSLHHDISVIYFRNSELKAIPLIFSAKSVNYFEKVILTFLGKFSKLIQESCSIDCTDVLALQSFSEKFRTLKSVPEIFDLIISTYSQNFIRQNFQTSSGKLSDLLQPSFSNFFWGNFTKLFFFFFFFFKSPKTLKKCSG